MIDVQDLTRRILVQFILTFVWAMINSGFGMPPTETSPILKIITALASLTLLIGLIPGSFLWKAIPKIASKAHPESVWFLLTLAIFGSIAGLSISAFRAYRSYSLIRSGFPDSFLSQLNAHQVLTLEVIGSLLFLSILLTHILFLLRSRWKSEQAVK